MRQRRPTGADRDPRTWGTNPLVDDLLKLFGLDGGDVMYTADDQLQRFAREVPEFRQVHVYETGYAYMYDTPENEIIEAWRACVRERSPIPIHELYHSAEAGVKSFARNSYILPYHIVPSRLASTVWMVKAQSVPDKFPDPGDLIYRYNSPHAAAGRMLAGRAPGAIARPNVVQQVQAPPRHRRRINTAGASAAA